MFREKQGAAFLNTTEEKEMCYTAIPGNSGIRALRDISCEPRLAVKPVQTTPVIARQPSNYPLIYGGSGKGFAKRIHKPEWRMYEKF